MELIELVRLLEMKTGKSVKKSGGGYVGCCPAHNDSSPSLSLCEGNEGKLLINCFTGCSTENICSSLGIAIADLFPERIAGQVARKRIEYPYHDEEGRVLFTKIRVEPGFDGKDKSFYWEREDENGNVIRSLSGCRKILYQLPKLLKGLSEKQTIFLVEGEKDADILLGYSLVATTAPESLKWPDEFSEVLKEADIVILYDMDKTGWERRDLLCKKLCGLVKRLRVVSLPGLKYQDSHGKDVSDWLALGNTTQQLVEIVAKTPDYILAQPSGKIRAVTVNEFLNMQLPKREMLLAPFLPSQGLGLLYAKRGVGKTHVALGIACAVATGGVFLKWQAPRPRKVLYIDGEMPAAAMQERLLRISVTEDLKFPDPSFFRLITPDLQDGAMPDLATREGRNGLMGLMKESELIIIDNISTLFRSGDENEADSWQPVQDWALELRRLGKSVLFIHHAAKGGQQRGTSKREDILDVVMLLKQPQGYRQDQGASFEVNFEKTRHFAGDDAASFQVRLVEQDDGLWLWEIDQIKPSSEIIEVAKAINEGLTIEETMQRTGLTKSQVETRKKKAKEQGLIS
ncbi:MAG: AAA family ATPase [Parachlamydia sp.]|jgi:putative DNA primase/helicase|nr:AAA family ATPase [Parachlamydia sp.]